MKDIQKIISLLNDKKKDYGLEGVEITEKDAEMTLALMSPGEGQCSEEQAIDGTLYGMRLCLDLIDR